MKLDPNHPLDKLMIKLFRDETVSFDEYEDAQADLDDEEAEKPDFLDYLAQIGVSVDDAIRNAREFQTAFYRRAEEFGLDFADPVRFFRAFEERAKSNPSTELLLFYCEMLCCSSLLADRDNTEFSDLEAAAYFMDRHEDAEILFADLSKRAMLGQRFLDTISKARKGNPHKISCDIKRKDLIFQRYNELFSSDQYTKDENELFLDNIDYLLCLAESTSELHLLAPLFLYQVLIRHGKRLHNSDSLNFNMKSLWKYHEYKVDENNGKNFFQNAIYIRLFSELCKLYRDDSKVDLELCIYGFDQLSNLGNFYRIANFNSIIYYEAKLEDLHTEEWPPQSYMAALMGVSLQFPDTVEDIVDESGFSCAEFLFEKNVIMTSDNISLRKLERFQNNSHYRQLLEKIEDYLNQHIEQLQAEYEDLNYSDENDIRLFFSNVLGAIDIPSKMQPQKLSELSMVFAFINNKMISVMDESVNRLVWRTGLYLIKSRV